MSDKRLAWLEEQVKILQSRIEELEAQVRQLGSWQDLEDERHRNQEYFGD